jgi:hypothetical protein
MPFMVLFIIYSSLTVYLTCEWPLLPEFFGAGTTIFLIVTALLFGYSYVQVILLGPGYLPFYFPYENPNSADRTADALSGMVTNVEQEFYVKTITLPYRTGFFHTAHRIVIRPDHFCGWATTFIGRKNHKSFFLFNFWGVVYISVFTISTFLTILGIARDEETILQLIICVIYLILGISFAILTGWFAVTLFYGISINQTTFENMNKVHRGEDRGCLGNWEEIFGSRRKWYLWLMPIPAFPTDDDRLLLMSDDRQGERHPFL